MIKRERGLLPITTFLTKNSYEFSYDSKHNLCLDRRSIGFDKFFQPIVYGFVRDTFWLTRNRYLEGDKIVKREVLNELGSNREIMGKKVLISLEKWFIPLYLMTKKHNDEMARLEPDKFGFDYNKNEALNRLRLSWLRGWDSNPRPID